MIEIEAAGFRLTALEFHPETPPNPVIRLEPSSIPVEIQRLYGPQRIR
ncbi:hypothetical protein [Methylothermus subterraneus]